MTGSALSEWIERHGMTEQEAFNKARIDYADWSNLMRGYYTMPCIALAIGKNLGMTPDEVRPLGRVLDKERFWDSEMQRYFPENFSQTWYKQVSYYRSSRVTKLIDKPKKPPIVPVRFCVMCGKQIQSKRNSKYCLECSTIVAARAADNAERRGPIIAKRDTETHCPMCGKLITNGYTYCSKECQENAHKPNKLPKVAVKCEYCGKEFVKNSHNQRFCCKQCADFAGGYRKPPEAKNMTKCPWCGVMFTPNKKLHQIYCSKRCRTYASKARKKAEALAREQQNG